MTRTLAPLFLMGFLACTHPEGGASPGDLASRSGEGTTVVYAVNYPLQYFTERIGGDLVEAVFPGPPASDPSVWSPSAEVIGEYQRADLIVLNGAGYAGWVGRAMLPSARLVDAGSAFQDRLIQLEGSITHSHGAQGMHSHVGWAGETWLDPTLAVAQARAIAAALTGLRPDSAERFAAGLAALESELGELDTAFAEVAERLGDRLLVFSHPVFQYFARRYGLNAIAVDWTADKAPGYYRWAQLDEKLAGREASEILWVSPPVPEAVEAVAERGLDSVVLTTCASRPGSGDFLDAMRANLAALQGLL